MATYFIGDIQGCFKEFSALLDQLNFSHGKDTLYLAGDIIGRGPDSLATLAYVTQHQSSITTVLGNHDLHFLSIANGIKNAKPSDRFEPLLTSKQLTYYVDYLRQQPLIIDFPEQSLVLSHAGISPQWDLSTAKDAASAVSNYLAGDNYRHLLSQMYHGDIALWRADDDPLTQMIYAINSLTRMRYCYDDGKLEFNQKCALHQADNSQLTAWFNLPTHLSEDYKAIFGHWASLMGQTQSSQFIALDTGCLWGNYLSAWNAQTGEITRQHAITG